MTDDRDHARRPIPPYQPGSHDRLGELLALIRQKMEHADRDEQAERAERWGRSRPPSERWLEHYRKTPEEVRRAALLELLAEARPNRLLIHYQRLAGLASGLEAAALYAADVGPAQSLALRIGCEDFDTERAFFLCELPEHEAALYARADGVFFVAGWSEDAIDLNLDRIDRKPGSAALYEPTISWHRYYNTNNVDEVLPPEADIDRLLDRAICGQLAELGQVLSSAAIADKLKRKFGEPLAELALYCAWEIEEFGWDAEISDRLVEAILRYVLASTRRGVDR
jgi:hypothetical protein